MFKGDTRSLDYGSNGHLADIYIYIYVCICIYRVKTRFPGHCNLYLASIGQKQGFIIIVTL